MEECGGERKFRRALLEGLESDYILFDVGRMRGDQVRITGVNEADEDAAPEVVKNHAPPDPPPSADDELDGAPAELR